MSVKPFTLHAVLEYRKQQENIAGARLQAAEKEAVALDKELNQIRLKLSDQEQTLIRIQAEGVSVTRLIMLEEQHAHFKESAFKTAELLEQKKNQVKQLRSALIEKSRQRQAMEKLKTKQDSAWKNHLNKQETALLDEIALLNPNR